MFDTRATATDFLDQPDYDLALAAASYCTEYLCGSPVTLFGSLNPSPSARGVRSGVSFEISVRETPHSQVDAAIVNLGYEGNNEHTETQNQPQATKGAAPPTGATHSVSRAIQSQSPKTSRPGQEMKL